MKRICIIIFCIGCGSYSILSRQQRNNLTVNDIKKLLQAKINDARTITDLDAAVAWIDTASVLQKLLYRKSPPSFMNMQKAYDAAYARAQSIINKAQKSAVLDNDIQSMEPVIEKEVADVVDVSSLSEILAYNETMDKLQTALVTGELDTVDRIKKARNDAQNALMTVRNSPYIHESSSYHELEQRYLDIVDQLARLAEHMDDPALLTEIEDDALSVQVDEALTPDVIDKMKEEVQQSAAEEKKQEATLALEAKKEQAHEQKALEQIAEKEADVEKMAEAQDESIDFSQLITQLLPAQLAQDLEKQIAPDGSLLIDPFMNIHTYVKQLSNVDTAAQAMFNRIYREGTPASKQAIESFKEVSIAPFARKLLIAQLRYITAFLQTAHKRMVDYGSMPIPAATKTWLERIFSTPRVVTFEQALIDPLKFYDLYLKDIASNLYNYALKPYLTKEIIEIYVAPSLFKTIQSYANIDGLDDINDYSPLKRAYADYQHACGLLLAAFESIYEKPIMHAQTLVTDQNSKGLLTTLLALLVTDDISIKKRLTSMLAAIKNDFDVT